MIPASSAEIGRCPLRRIRSQHDQRLGRVRVAEYRTAQRQRLSGLLRDELVAGQRRCARQDMERERDFRIDSVERVLFH